MSEYEYVRPSDFELETEDEQTFRHAQGARRASDIDDNAAAEQRRAGEQLVSPTARGPAESAADEGAASIVPPLALDAEFVRQCPSYVGELEVAYAQYTTPMRLTLGAMGRVKDLQRAGAPLTAEEAMADKRLARRLTPLGTGGRNRQRGPAGSDGAALNAYNQWSETRTQVAVQFGQVLQAQDKLATAIETLKTAQLMLERRAKRAELADKQDKLAQIEQTAATLARVVTVSVAALQLTSAVTSVLATMEIVDTAGDPPEFGRGLTTGALEAAGDTGTPWGSKTQKAAKWTSKAAQTVAQINRDELVKQVTSNPTGLSLKSIFIVATGDAGRYEQLIEDIDGLASRIAALDVEIESGQIKTAIENLKDFEIGLDRSETALRASVPHTRKAARAFNLNMDGGDIGRWAMYAADAYQDLVLYGTRARDDNARVDALGRQTDAFVGGQRLWMEAEGHVAAYHDLRAVLTSIYAQRRLFAEQHPIWHQRADGWERLLSHLGGDEFTT